jgi:hypothetical protein
VHCFRKAGRTVVGSFRKAACSSHATLENLFTAVFENQKDQVAGGFRQVHEIHCELETKL